LRRTLLAAVLIFSTGPARSQSQPDPATAQPTGQASSQSSSSPEDDIQTLKATVRELQSRLDQLSASADESKAPARFPLFARWNHGLEQIGIRYGYLDLQNKGVNGATLNDIVVGLNWFLNPNAKIQWNLAIDHRESTPPGSSGWTYIFGSRLAIDF